jgi:hypothetical protein
MTKSELDVITYCLLFIRKDIQASNYTKLFGSREDTGAKGAYHTINDVCTRAHVDYMKGEGR